MTIDNNIRDEKLKYDTNKEAAKIWKAKKEIEGLIVLKPAKEKLTINDGNSWRSMKWNSKY